MTTMSVSRAQRNAVILAVAAVLLASFAGVAVLLEVAELMSRHAPPVGVDLVRRRKGREEFIHLINRTSSPPTEPPATAVEEIPPVGPVE